MRHSDLERELQLILLLTENREYTVRQMCDRLGISLRSIYYYLEFMRDCGFIVCKRGPYYSLDKSSPFFMGLLRKTHFTEDEALTMRRLLDSADPNNMHIQHLKRKIERLYDLGILDNVALREQVARNVSQLYEAVKRQKAVVLHDYSSPHSDTVSSRVVEPFLFLDNNNEIRCYEMSSKTNKTFKVARIGHVEILADDWCHSDCHKRVYTDVFMFSGERTMPIELRMGRLACNLLVEEYPQAAQYVTADGPQHWLLRMPVCSYIGISRFVLGLFENVEVLGDEGFKEHLRARIGAMAEKALLME